MSAESKEITIQVLHIHSKVRSTLGTIHYDRYIMLVSDLDHLLYWIHRTQYIAHLGNTYDFSTIGEQMSEFIEVNLTFIINRNNTDGNSLLSSLQLPRHDIGMVLHCRNNHLIALAHKLITER